MKRAIVTALIMLSVGLLAIALESFFFTLNKKGAISIALIALSVGLLAIALESPFFTLDKKRAIAIAQFVGVATILLTIIRFTGVIELEPQGVVIEPVSDRLPPVPTSISLIDRILETMEWGNIAFNAPATMKLEDTARIQLLLGLKNSIEQLSQMVEAEGAKEGARVKVSNYMEARLSGSGFQITAITPEVQAITSSDVTEWKWEVEAVRPRSQHLHLTLSAIFNVEGTSATRTIRTFDKTIEVTVTWPQRISSFLANNWQWLWATLLVPVAGWLWKRRKT